MGKEKTLVRLAEIRIILLIFGQSAGAFSVQTMLVSPLTRGDIAGSIIMSCADINWPGSRHGAETDGNSRKTGR